MKNKYLLVYDYGQGGVWLYIYADSPEQILEKYPELEIINYNPDWLTGDILTTIEKNRTYDINSTPSGFLEELIKQRKSPAVNKTSRLIGN